MLFDPESLRERVRGLLVRAEETRASAETMRDAKSRAQMLQLALSYEDMAETLEGIARRQSKAAVRES